MVDYESAKAEILAWIAETIQVPVEKIDMSKPLTEIGLDSLDAVHMISTIESIIKQELPEDIMQQVTCLNEMFEMMREKLAAA